MTCQDSVAEPPCGDNFLTDLRGFLDHLKATVDPSYEYYEEFKLLAMYATMFGQAEVLPNPAATKATIVTKYSALRKMMQASVVRSSKLKPRIGLAPLEAQGADISPIADAATTTVHNVSAIFASSELVMLRLKAFLDQNPPAAPVIGHACCGQAFGGAMMELMPIMTGGSPPKGPQLMESVVMRVLVDIVLKTIPDEFDCTLIALANLSSHSQTAEAPDDAAKTPLSIEAAAGRPIVELSVLKAMRWQLLASLMKQVPAT